MSDTSTTKNADKRPIRILSAGAKGGPGKSFVVKNLSAAAAQSGLNTAVVDFDKQQTLTKWLHRRDEFFPNGPAISGYIADPANPDDAAALESIVGHDILFIDIPPSVDSYSSMLKTLAFAADLIIVPTKVGIADTESVETLLRALREWRRPTLAMLNQVKPRSRQVRRAKHRLMAFCELSAVEICDHTDYLQTDEAGLGATEARRCSGADDIQAVWRDVARRCGIELPDVAAEELAA